MNFNIAGSAYGKTQADDYVERICEAYKKTHENYNQLENTS